MRYYCAISGLQLEVSFFPSSTDTKGLTHPIFSLPQRKLLPFLSRWSAGSLTPTDSYLLFLAILNSTDLVEFRVPVKKTPLTDSIVATHMESLAKVVTRISSTRASFPIYAISPDTCTLANIQYWIENWNACHEDYLEGNRQSIKNDKLRIKEAALERLIKNPHKPISEYATRLADWAAMAASFPTFNTQSPFSPLPITLSDYWKLIIQKISRNETLHQVPRGDILELVEHCRENISIHNSGSIYSSALFKLLEGALEKQKAFLGFGDQDLIHVSYTILSESTSVEDGNIKTLIDKAPEKAPERSEYPSDFAFFRAKMRYQMAKKAGK